MLPASADSRTVYTGNHENEYRAFLVQNQAFWRENTGYPRDAESILYVDLAHDNPAYLALNLWIAKYIQKFRGGRLVGLAHGWMKPCAYYNFDRVREFAHSFLIDEVIDLDREADDLDANRRFEAEMRDRSGSDLRRAVLNFEMDRDPDIGWILYDTWIRQEHRGSFEIADPEFFDCARAVFRMRRAVSRSMQKGKTVGAVIGHYHYSPYSFMALEATRQEAPAYFQSILVPVSVRRFITQPDVRRGRPADFLDAYEQHVVASAGAERLASFERRVFDIQRNIREFFRVTPVESGDGHRRDILTAYGLDPKLPVVCFYSPALCGAPHCFGPIPFDDFGDWLRCSLDAAARIANVNFLIKPHPQDSVYDTSNLLAHFQNLYRGVPNVRFLSETVPSSQLTSICDLVATVSGTPGYEMALRGVPTVAAGPSRYSGLGFAQEPADLTQYEALLASAGEHKLSSEQQRRALTFAFFELALGRSISLFIPPVRAVGTAEFWREAERNLCSRFPEEDPLYRNVGHMLAENLPFLLNTDLAGVKVATAGEHSTDLKMTLGGLHAVSLTAIRALEAQAAQVDRECARAKVERDGAMEAFASLLPSGRAVRFGQGESGNIFLGAGWSAPEVGGIWTDGHEAALTLPFLESEVRLCIECHAYTPEHSPMRRISVWSNGRLVDEREFNPSSGVQQWRLRARPEHRQLEIVFRIADPATPLYEGRRLGLWLSSFWLEPAGAPASNLPTAIP